MATIDVFRPEGSTAGFFYDGLVVGAVTAAIALGAQLTVPLPGTDVPATLQTVAIIVGGAWLGTRRGTLAPTLYIAAGAYGLPIFAGGIGGVGHLTGATGGYLLGFIAAGGVAGALSDTQPPPDFTQALLIAMATTGCVLVAGVIGLCVAGDMAISAAVDVGVRPQLLGAAVKALVCAALITGGAKFAERVT